MERETKEVRIGSNMVEIKTYATGREATAIQQAYLKSASVEIVGGEARVKDFNPSALDDVRAEMIRQLVVSLNGDNTNLVDRCIDLPNEEYVELVATLDELAAAKKKT